MLWFNHFSREMYQAGELQQLIAERGVVGLTLDPTLLERAVGERDAYDESLSEQPDRDTRAVLESLILEDVRLAADALRPTFDATGGVHGYVCLSVLPPLPALPEQLLAEVRRLFHAVSRPNVMIGMGGEPANLTAIEEAIFGGVNVCVTGLFSLQGYQSAAESYLRALERRLFARMPVRGLASVAQFDVGRVDAMADKGLENNLRSAQSRGDLGRVSANNALLGKVAVANARCAHALYHDVFFGERFTRLREAGAHVQRLLWAHAEPPNPLQPRGLYYNQLVSADTLTLANAGSVLVFAESEAGHAEVPALDLPAAHDVLRRAEDLGIDLDMIQRKLQHDIAEEVEEAYRKLLTRVDGKRKALITGFIRRQSLVLGVYQDAVESTLRRLRRQLSITRTWARDAALWKESPAQVALIRSRLGWLTVATDGRIDHARLRALREESRAAGWTHIVYLGMGGSCLAVEAMSQVFGPRAGYPALIVMDSTHPDALRAVEAQIDMSRTLFVVASKTGNTQETIYWQRYFYSRYHGDAGEHFIAVTDAGSRLEAEARALHFRQIFLNPEDMSGRYAALSYTGLVPAALAGLPFERIVETAAEMQAACGSGVMGNNHPGLWLGTILGALANHGRDKLTIVGSPQITHFSPWIEQLVAGSLGKEGKGIIPIAGATIGMPHDYDDDRLFVYLRLDAASDNPDTEVQALREAGHPVVTLALRDVEDMGAEFFRWEFAVAVAGMILGVNPFDDPNVAASKQNTARLLDIFQKTGALPALRAALVEDSVSLYTDEATARLLGDLSAQHAYETTALPSLVAAFLSLARSGDYIAFLSYLNPTTDVENVLQDMRRRARHVLKRAVVIGTGPRYLHSTGQLHKGGPAKGLFVQITADDGEDLPIPLETFGFKTLLQAQADGDFEALQAKGQRALRLHLGGDVQAGLAKLAAVIEALAAKRR